MIAIAVVSVMSGGTSSAQTALETTLAREEIDAQAEALRFIQASYISDKGNANSRFVNLWQEITKKAINLNDISEQDINKIIKFTPSTCSELYQKNDADFNGNIFDQKAFIINTHKLGSFTADDVDSVYVSSNAEDGNKLFEETKTYPRLVFEDPNKASSNLAEDEKDTLYGVNGIYVIAVKDSDTTVVVNENGNKATSAFYDFYIRTCWYGSGADEVSTISTVIRLYDPDAAAVVPESPEEEPEEPTPEEPGD